MFCINNGKNSYFRLGRFRFRWQSLEMLTDKQSDLGSEPDRTEIQT